MFELPSNVNIAINQTSVQIKFDKSAEVVATSIDAYWINGQGTYDNETGGTSFTYDGLTLGTIYKFKLKVRSADGSTLESGEYSFSTPTVITPTVPTNIVATIDSTIKNKVTISFKKGQGIRTEIDAYWVNGQGTYDQYTVDESFIFENLQWGTQYKFKLRSASNDGVTYATSEEVIFNIETENVSIPPTPPTNISATANIFVVDNEAKNTVTIAFTEGEGLRTEIDAYWLNGMGTYDSSTTDGKFVFNNLPFGAEYKYKLRTIAYNDVDVSETQELSFTIDGLVVPTVPTNIVIEAPNEFKVNDITLKFTQGNGGTTELLKSWGDSTNTWVPISSDEDLLFNDLDFETAYYIKLRSVTSLGLYAATNIVSFTIPKAIHPTIPLNVTYEIDPILLNKVTIKFNKGAGLRTEMDFNSQGTWNEYSTDQGFILQYLEFGQTYTFQLRSVGNTGEVALSKEFSFEIKAIEPVEAPARIKIIRDNYNVAISFEKGKGALTTEICKLWEGNDYTDGTAGTEIDLVDLEPGKKYRFILKSVGQPFMDRYNNKSPNCAITEKQIIVMPKYAEAIVPEFTIETYGYNSYIMFTKVDGLRVGIKKSWLHDGVNDIDERKVESPTWKYDNPDYDKEYSRPEDSDTGNAKYDAIANACDDITTDGGFALERLFTGDHKFTLVALNNYGEYSESTENNVVIGAGYVYVLTDPTIPTDISFAPTDNNCVIRFKKGNGVKTEINRTWEDDPVTFGEATTGSSFYVENLEPGNVYYFRLRTVNTLGKMIESECFSFTTTGVANEYGGANEDWVTDKPTPPTEISFETDAKSCSIKFNKGVGSRTEIDKQWLEASGTWGEYTLDNGFYIDGLTPQTRYIFKLRSKNSLGETAETEELSFFTSSGVEGEEVVNDKPTQPTDVTITAEGTCITIKFKKGVGCRTEIDRHWLEPSGTWGEHTTGDGFFFDGLEVGTTYGFKLRSINSLNETSETEELTARTIKDGGGDGYYVDVKGDVPNGYYSNYEEKWFYTPNSNGIPIGVTGEIKEKFEQIGAYYYGNPNTKVVYFTFDEGYEVGNSNKILDTLREHNVHGTFFITKKYLDENPEIVKRMVREGHTVGNHSSTHPSMANVERYYGFEGVEKELMGLENEFRNVTGATMLKFFRPPMGKYSEQALIDIKKLGYKIAFWSFAYADFDVNHQKDYDWVLDYSSSSAFNGCIYLLHAVSSTNAAILGELIKHLKDNGYTIKDLRSLEHDCQIN